MTVTRKDHRVQDLWDIDLNAPPHPPDKMPLLTFKTFIAGNGNFPVSQHIAAGVLEHMLRQHDLIPTTDALDYNQLQSIIEKSRQPALETLYQQWIRINSDAHLYLRLTIMFVGLDFIRCCIENSSCEEKNNPCLQDIFTRLTTVQQSDAMTMGIDFIKSLNQTFKSIKDILREQYPADHPGSDNSRYVPSLLTRILRHRENSTTLSYFILTLTQRMEELSQFVDHLKTTDSLFQHCRQPPMPNHIGHGIELGPVRAK